MICVGSFKSLESLRDKPRFTGAPFEVRTWVGSDTRLISPLVDWLMHGRGIHLMKLAMDEVSFAHGGTEVRMRKSLWPKQEMPAWCPHDRIARRLVSRPSPGFGFSTCASGIGLR